MSLGTLSGIIDAVRSYAPQFIFTTTLPPMVTAGFRDPPVCKVFERAARQPIHRSRHQTHASPGGPAVLANPSTSFPSWSATRERCKAASDILLRQHGASSIQPMGLPTARCTAIGAERLRITPSPGTTKRRLRSRRGAHRMYRKRFGFPWPKPKSSRCEHSQIRMNPNACSSGDAQGGNSFLGRSSIGSAEGAAPRSPGTRTGNSFEWMCTL